MLMLTAMSNMKRWILIVPKIANIVVVGHKFTQIIGNFFKYGLKNNFKRLTKLFFVENMGFILLFGRKVLTLGEIRKTGFKYAQDHNIQ